MPEIEIIPVPKTMKCEMAEFLVRWFSGGLRDLEVLAGALERLAEEARCELRKLEERVRSQEPISNNIGRFSFGDANAIGNDMGRL
ncbi:MAG: hypothetical protein KME16_26915 [Scytolyngbya sp. HA4215-MV1]|nr:hypothetical protein [Scytolyngbya sp. HA4215-MV1]